MSGDDVTRRSRRIVDDDGDDDVESEGGVRVERVEDEVGSNPDALTPPDDMDADAEEPEGEDLNENWLT
jgi:hypothetical protein